MMAMGVCDSNEYVGQRGNIDPRFKIETLKLIDGGSAQPETSLAILLSDQILMPAFMWVKMSKPM